VVIAGLLMVIGFVPILVSWIRSLRILTPLNLFVLGQSFGLGFSLLKLDERMSDFVPTTWIVYITMNSAFILGYLVLGSFLKSPSREPEQRTVLPGLVWIPCLLVGLTFIGLLMGYRAMGEWPLFSKASDEVRGGFLYPNLIGNIFIQLAYPASALSALLVFGGNSRREKVIAFVLWLSIPCAFLLAAARHPILFSLVCLAISWETQRKPVAVKWVVLGVIGFLALFSATMVMRMGNGSSELLRIATKLPALVEVIVTPVYTYFANNFWNLDWALSHFDGTRGHPPTYGFSSLQGFSFYFRVNEPIVTAYNFDGLSNHFAIKSAGLNTISYQWTLIKDFGLLIGTAVCFLLGWISRGVYSKAIQTGSVVSSYFAIFICFYSFYSFLVFPGSLPQNAIYLAVGFLMIPLLNGLPVFGKPKR